MSPGGRNLQLPTKFHKQWVQRWVEIVTWGGGGGGRWSSKGEDFKGRTYARRHQLGTLDFYLSERTI